jgi:hypothetical protein
LKKARTHWKKPRAHGHHKPTHAQALLAYGTDGNYFSKPNVQDIFETIYEMMNEADPARYPMFYSAR